MLSRAADEHIADADDDSANYAKNYTPTVKRAMPASSSVDEQENRSQNSPAHAASGAAKVPGVGLGLMAGFRRKRSSELAGPHANSQVQTA